ncbi:nucleotide-binding universal stress UspA family protein [Streptomyces sp. TLI_55]|uniref:universal stress protein n=1 Tax=Streptomyces sp. TLI_55 TaxID=1938861 RepID=UPI000BD40C0F|nr:universal stress protein [Streptomyces sp. TLI_55]SNX55722.1 nucleotide-binding universal stress UspA family protein [Streptomyces sp. TLI_55]
MSVFQRILVAVDPDPARLSAIRLAGDLAKLTNAEVRVLHVLASAASLATVVPLEDDAEGKAVVDEALAILAEKGVRAEGSLARGLTTQVAESITESAEAFGADLIILTPHHRGSVEALFNPRVSDAVAHRTSAAVLLAPEGPAEDGMS